LCVQRRAGQQRDRHDDADQHGGKQAPVGEAPPHDELPRRDEEADHGWWSVREPLLRLPVAKLDQQETDNHIASQARIDVFRNDKFLATLTPERRFYKASGQPTTEVAIWPHLSKPLEILQHPHADIYLVFAGMAEDNQRAVLQIYINPLVLWVWVGGAVMVFGTGIALVPSRPPQPGRPTRKRKPTKERDEVAA